MRVALAILLLSIGQPAQAAWTFCVAESDQGKEIWITRVFSAAYDRVRLEAEFKSVLHARGVLGPVVQCPAPSADRTAVVNSQFIAEEFHRRQGDVVHPVPALAFERKP